MRPISGAIARREARLFAEMAPDPARLDLLEDDLDRLVTVLQETPALRQVLTAPLFRREERLRVLVALADHLAVQDETGRFLARLAASDRVGGLPAIREAFRSCVDAVRGRVRVRVVLARPAPAEDTLLARLRARLAEATGKTVVTEVAVDPALIAGLKVQVGSVVIDGTVAAHARAMRQILAQGGEQR